MVEQFSLEILVNRCFLRNGLNPAVIRFNLWSKSESLMSLSFIVADDVDIGGCGGCD